MMKSIQFDRFKALKEVTVPLDSRISVLVGANASGKSSVLDGISFVGRLLEGVSLENLAPEELITADGGSRDFFVWLDLSSEKIKFQFKVSESGNPILRFNDGPPSSEWTADADLRKRFGRCVPLKLEPTRLAEPVPAGPNDLQFSGNGLANVLASMKLSDDEKFLRIQEHLRRLVPSVIALSIVQKMSGQAAFEISFKTTTGENIPAKAMSDGTLMLLGILTALEGPATAKTILLDDIDKGLHPKAQTELVELIHKLLDEQPHLQIVATSHSPYLIDALAPEEVILTALHPTKGTQCLKLSDHPEVEKWSASTLPGEFWSMVGEDWILDTETKAP